ncbi:MAG: 2-hydroxyglutaryl-CoA dehydratase [Deltaproteobacteria bacterium]|nr:2-hydroxyglutaryl-CoA dehydratase [Deltaproteobacteria bacterium]
MSDAVAIGVDCGSTTTKAVAIDSGGRILYSVVERSHPRIEEQTERCLALLRERTGAAASVPIGATGYGRKRIAASRVLTEITCHARGAFFHTGKACTLVDMGGQDTKVIRVGPGGDVQDFAMNDKCAAGTGRFLEVILARLEVPLDEIAQRAAGEARPVSISSTCTVFAESEVISLVAQGEPVAGILAGLHRSLASRVASLAGSMAADADVRMSGGVAKNATMVEALGRALGRPIGVLPDPQLVGALGAALWVR